MGFPISRRVVTFVVAGLCLLAQISVMDALITIKKPNYPKDEPSTSKMGLYKTAAVAANGPECATIGKNMLLLGGSAVDAAIATLLCDGVVSAHSMGLGGGFLMTIWDSEKREAVCLNAREVAPAAATVDMFKNASEAKFGGKSIAVPGELYGYWVAHQKYGRLSWATLFEPTIAICERGSIVNKYIADVLREIQDNIQAESSMREIFIDPKTNQTWEEGSRIRRPKLAQTLRKLATSEDPVKEFYSGEIAQQMVKEIQDMGGIMTLSDFQNYKPKWEKPIVAHLEGKTLYTVPPPGSGVILSFIMQILDHVLPTVVPEVFWQRLIETFKWAYARRSELGDLDHDKLDVLIRNMTSPEYLRFVRNAVRDDWTSQNASFYGAEHETAKDAGTANVCVIEVTGSAVAVTSTINHYLGSMRRSPSTGIIFNDEMDDFSSTNFANGFAMPSSPANHISPFKRPMSSMAPSILIDDAQYLPKMVIGSAGGTKITTAIATVMALQLYAGFNVKEAIDARRIHHQLFPMVVDYEQGVNKKILDHLEQIGHNVTSLPRMGSTVTALWMDYEKDPTVGDSLIIQANSDGRRQGSVDGYSFDHVHGMPFPTPY